MHDLNRQLSEVRDAVQIRWTEERARRVERSFQRRRQRRKVLHATGGVAAVLVLFFALRGFLGSTNPRSAAVPVPAPEGAGGPTRAAAPEGRDAMHLSDGSVVRLLSPASRILMMSAPLLDAPQSTTVEIQSGGARFQVAHDPSRVFRVQAGAVTAEVLGTEFTVERLGERARVAVEHGRVRVLWPLGRTELGAGQSGIFPPAPEAAPERVVIPDLDRTPQPPRSSVKLPARLPPQSTEPRRSPDRDDHGEPTQGRSEPAPRSGSSWAALAQEGRFDGAYETLKQQGLDVVRGPAELLLAADVARLSRHPADAVAPLRRLLREHPQDPRAPLAAFTLGRGLLDELGRPREAAEVFRAAQDLEPEGPLAADALAREVEAWSRAGETLRARERALLYLQRYPEGDRRRSVQRYGGIE